MPLDVISTNRPFTTQEKRAKKTLGAIFLDIARAFDTVLVFKLYFQNDFLCASGGQPLFKQTDSCRSAAESLFIIYIADSPMSYGVELAIYTDEIALYTVGDQ